MCWTCTCFHLCRTAIVHTCNGSPTKSRLWIRFGRQWRTFGTIQFRPRLPGHAYLYLYPNPNPYHTTCVNNCNPILYPYPNARSFVLAYRIMKLIITEQGNNAWLAHGTPHLNVRADFKDTETGIKPKHSIIVDGNI